MDTTLTAQTLGYLVSSIFFFTLIGAVGLLVSLIRNDHKGWYRDPELYALIVYCISALAYVQAYLRVVIGVHVSLEEQRTINLLAALSISWSVAIIACRRGYIDKILDRIFGLFS